jgi:hypothetical protein
VSQEPALAPLNLPAAQFEHSGEPAVENVPAEHSSHAVADVLPPGLALVAVLTSKLPASHREHTLDSALL